MRRHSSYTLLRAGVVIAFAILTGRLWYMQVVDVNAYRASAAATTLSLPRPVLAPRGIIYDRNGVPLVRNLPSLDVTVTPDEWPARTQTAESALLSSLLHGRPSARRIRQLVLAAQTHPTQPIPVKTNLGLHTYYLVQSHTNQLPGVEATVNLTRREYLDPPPYSLAHILGYTLPINPSEYKIDGDPNGPYRNQRYTFLDSVGQDGIESAFEHELHGSNGVERTRTDVFGNQVGPWKAVQPTVPGDGVRLTIDSRLQQQATLDLQAAMQKLAVPQGAAVVMNPSNGKVLALVSLPSYNDNVFTGPSGPKRTHRLKAIYNNPSKPLFNIATQGQMPPGSIYKIITATAGLEDGVISPTTEADDTGVLQRCPSCLVFHGWNPAGLGWVNVVGAIEQSSDIFFYQVAGGGPNIPGNGLGPYRLGHWARLYNLGKPTGIELPNESAGLVPSPSELMRTQHRPWSYGDSYNMGIGQGDDLVTPLQMATAVSVIANGGSLVRPRVVDAVTTPNGKTALPGRDYGLVPDIIRRHFVAPWVVSLIREGMRLGVTSTSGTSHFNVDLRNQSSGKTGTAQTGTGVDAWWIGFAPFNHPRIAVSVVIPNAGAEGAFSAAPIGSKIIDDYLGIKDPGWLSQVQKVLDFNN